MPPDELFEWEAYLRYEAEEQEKARKKSHGKGQGGRKRARF